MMYEIYCDGTLIAKFRYLCDRDLCLDELREKYPDCDITAN